MAMEQKTKIIIETESGNTEAQLKKVANGLQDVGKSSKKAREQVSSSSKAMTTDLVAFAAKASTALAAAKTAYNWTKEAANFQEVALYTKASTESMGLSFDRLVSASQRGANGMASAATIMKANLKALNAGLTASEDEFGRLWQIADAIGDKTGQTIEQTFEQITTAITSGNSRALISLGALPESFGKAGNAADLLNKKGEILKTVLSQLGAKADDVAKYGDTAADSFNKFEVAVEDFKNSAGSLLLPVLESIVGVLADIVTTGTKAINVVAMAMAIKPGTNQYNAYTVEELNALKAQKSQSIANLKYQLTAGNAARDGSTSYRSGNSNLAELGVNLTNTKAQLEAEKKELALIEEALINNNRLAAKRAEIEEQTRQKIEEQTKAGERNNKNTEDQLAKARQIADEAQRLIDRYDDLAESLLPKNISKTSEMFKLMTDVTSQAALLPNYFTISGEKIEEVNRRLAEMRAKMLDDISNAPSLLQANSPETIFANQGFQKQYAQLVQNAGLIMMGGGLMANVSSVNGLVPNNNDTKKVGKDFWSSIKGDYSEAMAAAMTQGIMDSNLAEALASFGRAQAGNYGSQLLGGLLSGGTKSLSGAFATGGAGWGLVAGVAIDYVASNWKKWTGDKGKEETFASVANTKERGSNAYLNTYKSELNPYLSNEDLYRIYNARSDVWSKGMTVSWSERDRSSHWLTGAKSYHDTTPQSTYDVIAALEKANELAEKSAIQKEREMDLMAAQGKGYQVVTEQVDLLRSALNRVSADYKEFNWTSGEKFSIDLSDNIQDLKKAYYDALREYGTETASRTTQKNNTFLSMFPYLNGITTGDAGFIPTYTKTRSGGLGSLLGGSRVNVRYDYYNNLSTTTARDGAYAMYNAFEDVFDNYLNDSESKYGTDMINLIKQAGFNQFNLSSMQYSDPLSYTESYLDMLEKQQDAAYEVMWRSEEIYRDMAKTVEERQGALQDYQEAQNQYYNTKLEIMANEAAKEEQLKKEQQQAALRAGERMEALLGFTGEMARTGNAIYILEGANQMGALEELLEASKDNPQAVAAIQALMKAANNQAKFGKI